MLFTLGLHAGFEPTLPRWLDNYIYLYNTLQALCSMHLARFSYFGANTIVM